MVTVLLEVRALSSKQQVKVIKTNNSGGALMMLRPSGCVFNL